MPLPSRYMSCLWIRSEPSETPMSTQRGLLWSQDLGSSLLLAPPPSTNMKDSTVCPSTASLPGSSPRRSILPGPLCPGPSAPSAQGLGAVQVTSTSSSSSEQRLLGSSFSPGPAVDGIIRVQPKSELKSGELKPLSRDDLGLHAYRCEDCGKCKCKECTYPRPLPSDWICDKQCLCSAQNVIDYGTCVCCVKGLFYHCSNDDEDNCADNPCSCSQSHCCTRWSAMGVMSLFLPCLWCYLPAKGCLKLCQGCYDRVNRPGCRCKNSNTVCCKVPTVPPRNFEKPT